MLESPDRGGANVEKKCPDATSVPPIPSLVPVDSKNSIEIQKEEPVVRGKDPNDSSQIGASEGTRPSDNSNSEEVSSASDSDDSTQIRKEKLVVKGEDPNDSSRSGARESIRPPDDSNDEDADSVSDDNTSRSFDSGLQESTRSLNSKDSYLMLSSLVVNALNKRYKNNMTKDIDKLADKTQASRQKSKDNSQFVPPQSMEDLSDASQQKSLDESQIAPLQSRQDLSNNISMDEGSAGKLLSKFERL